jgi:hypothetical protein
MTPSQEWFNASKSHDNSAPTLPLFVVRSPYYVQIEAFGQWKTRFLCLTKQKAIDQCRNLEVNGYVARVFKYDSVGKKVIV